MGAAIRVLQVLGGLEAGGAEAFVMNLYRAVNKEMVQFDFVKHIEHKGVFEDEITKMGGKIYRCPQYNGKNHFVYCKWWGSFFKEHTILKRTYHRDGTADTDMYFDADGKVYTRDLFRRD